MADNNNNDNEKIVTLNEKIVTQTELDEKIEKSKTMKGVKIVEIAPNKFVQRIEG
jgi:hypothetical protein